MAQLVVRDLEPEIKARLKQRAERNGRSMEAEVRDILRRTVTDERRTTGLGSRMAARFRGHGLAVDLPELRGQRPRAADFNR